MKSNCAIVVTLLSVVAGSFFDAQGKDAGASIASVAAGGSPVPMVLVPATPANPAGGDDFIHVRMILETRCINCHGGEKTKSGLDLSTRELILKGGDTDGPAIIPGHPETSPLYLQITHKEDPGMPKTESKLPDGIIDEFKRWIEAGAPLEGKLSQAQRVPNRMDEWPMFKPVARPAVPAVKDAAFVRNPIDAFILHEQEARGLHPRPEAPKHVLLRRVTIDLIGLPPTPEEMRAFEADASPDAYEKVVDRLLADPRYGEGWGRHWLDIWRYSDSYQIGFSSYWGGAHAWRWRDWVVENLNKDTGYDQIVLQMLAGDELSPTDPDALRATGFVVRNISSDSLEGQQAMVEHTSKAFLGVTMNCARCHDHKFDPFTQKEYYGFCSIFAPAEQHPDPIPGKANVKADSIDRIYDAKPKALATLNKDAIDPCVPAALGGGKLVIQPVQVPAWSSKPSRRPYAIQDALKANQQAIDAARKALAGGKPEQIAELKARIAAAEARDASFKAALKVEDLEDAGKGKDAPEWIAAAKAATHAQREEEVAQDEVTVEVSHAALAKAKAAPAGAGQAEKAAKEVAAKTGGVAEAEKALVNAQGRMNGPPDANFKRREMTTYPSESSGRRLALARWIIDKKNPLTARVAVNHIWLRHFGVALEPTVTDFGHRAMPVSNVDLLNWLAAEFMEKNWSMKKLHRLIVTSSAYRMDSVYDPADAAIDSENTWLWRMNPRRMEAEAVRDTVLYLGNKLEAGPPGQWLKDDSDAKGDNYRRSLYYGIAQNKILPFLAVFDGPDVNGCYQRASNVSPQQALLLANSKFIHEQSQAIEKNLSSAEGGGETPGADDKFIDAAFALILNNRPTDAERSLCAKYLADRTATLESAKGGSDPKNSLPPAQRAREDLVQALFCDNEFLTIR